MSALAATRIEHTETAPVPDRRTTLRRVVRSEWVKLRSLRSTWLTMAAVLVVIVGFGAIASMVAGGEITTPNGGAPGGGADSSPLGTVLAGANLAVLIVAVLIVPTLIIAAGKGPSEVDEFMHWLPNAAYLVERDSFPTAATQGVSAYPAFPYNLAFIALAVSDLAGRTTSLIDEIGAADLVVMVATAGHDTQAAAILGEACAAKHVMTTVLLLGSAAQDDTALSRTLAILRPYARMLVIAMPEPAVNSAGPN